MQGFHKIGEVGKFRDDRGRAVTVEGHTIAVFRRGERFWAVSDECPHMGASLAMGRIVDRQVECAWHEWKFDLATGRNAFKSWACVTVYEVRVDGSDVLVRIPDEPAKKKAADALNPDDDWFVFDPDADLKKKDGPE